MFWSKLRVLDTEDVRKRKDLFGLLFFLLRKKCAWYYFMAFVLLFLICHLCPVHEVSADVLLLAVQLSLLPVNLFKNALFFKMLNSFVQAPT